MFINRILRWLDGLIIMLQFGYTCSSSDALLLTSDCSLMDELIPTAAWPSVLQLPLSNLGTFMVSVYSEIPLPHFLHHPQPHSWHSWYS